MRHSRILRKTVIHNDPPPDSGLQVSSRSAAERLRILEYLADDLPPALRVALKLALDGHRHAGGRNEKVINRLVDDREFGTDRDRIGIGGIDLPNW